MGLAWHLRFVQDDAFISYAYARSLVEGNGLTWLGTRVEGYTNFLWVVWIALGLQLGVAPVAWSYLGGLAALAGTLAATIRCARSPSAPALLGAWVVNTLGFGEAIPDRLTLTLIPIDERQGLVAWYLNRTAELDALVATWPSVELRR